MSSTPRNRPERGLLALVAVGLILVLLLTTPLTTPSTAAPLDQANNAAWRTYANGDDVWGLAFEGTNTLWAATRGGGVVKWDISNLNDPKAEQFLAPQSPLPGNIVRDVVVDSRSNKWFATNKGLARLTSDDRWETLTYVNTDRKLPSDTVTALALQGDQYLWVGTQQFWSATDKKFIGGGFARVDISADPPRVTHTWSVEQSDKVPSNNVTDIAVDTSNDDVWLTFRTDIQAITPDPNRPNNYFQQRFGGITVVHADLTLDLFQKTEEPQSWPKYGSLLSVAVDASGLKWFGTGDLTGGGAGFHILKGNTPGAAQWKGFAASGSSNPSGVITAPSLPSGANRIPKIALGPGTDILMSLAGTEPAIDYGEGMGICRLQWDRNFDSNNPPTCTAYDRRPGSTGLKLPGNLVRAIVWDGDRGEIFVGTSGRLPNADSALYTQGTEGHGIAALLNGKVLSTAAVGLSPSSNHINALAFSDQTVWIGSAYPVGDTTGTWGGRGVDYYDRSLGAAARWRHEPYDPDNISQAVSSLAFDSSGRLWVGLFREQRVLQDPDFNSVRILNGGLIDPSGSSLIFYERGDSLPAYSVSDIAIDGTKVWIGTGAKWPDPHGQGDVAAGLAVYDMTTGWGTPVQTPTLLGNDITDVFARDGQVWVANTWIGLAGEQDRKGGLSVFNGSDWTSIPIGTNGLAGGGNDLRSVYVTQSGVVWAGGFYTQRAFPIPYLSNALINWGQLTGATPPATWSSVTFRDDGWVSAIVERRINNVPSVWLGTTRGGQNPDDIATYLFFPPNGGNENNFQGGLRVFVNNQWRSFTPANSPLVSGHITTLAVDNQGTLWIGTTMGLMSYSGDVPQVTLEPVTPPPAFTPTATPPATSTNTPTPQAGATRTPAFSGSAATLTPAYSTVTPTPFPGSGSPPPEIPEASTIILLTTGLAGLGGYVRFFAGRRKHTDDEDIPDEDGEA